MITAIHHIALIVSSAETVDFYARLGFRESFRRERGRDTVVLMDGPGLRLEIFVDPGHPPRAEDPENLGLRHFALQVDSLEKTMEELKDTAEFGPIQRDWTGVRYCCTKDPDGLPIELHE